MIQDNGYWKILDIYSHTHVQNQCSFNRKLNVGQTGKAIANNNLETVATLGTKPQDDDKQKNPHT